MKRWLYLATALTFVLQSSVGFATVNEEHLPSSSPHTLPQISVNSNNSSEAQASLHRISWIREQVIEDESLLLTEQQRILREKVLKATQAEVNLISYAKKTLRSSKPHYETLLASLKQPAKLVEPSERGEFKEVDLHKLDTLIASLEEEKGKLSPQDPDRIILQDVTEHYKSYKQAVVNASPEHLQELLTPKVRLTGDHLGSYLIPQKIAQSLSWRDLYGFQPRRTNQAGNHRVLGKEGVHFKLSAAAHTEEGGMNELRPGIEYALSSFYQLLDVSVASPSTLLVLQNQRLCQLPANHPFTKGINIFNLENRVLAEDFLHRNPDVKQALEKAGITTYKEARFLQGALTAGDIGLDEFLVQAKDNPALLQKISMSSFSALFIASLLTNPSDWKPDNFRVKLYHNAEGTLESATLIAIDNDDALVPDVLPLYTGGHIVGLKNVLFFLKELMDKPIDSQFREAFLRKSPEAFLLEWVESLEEQNKRYASLLSEGALKGRALQNLSLPIRFTPGTLVTIYDKLVKIHQLLGQHEKINHTAIFRAIDPLVRYYYHNLGSLSPERLLSIVAKKDSTRVESYEALLREETCRPILLTALLYGQGEFFPLCFEDICNLNDGLAIGDKALTIKEILGDIKPIAESSSEEPTEELEQSWQDLARKTPVGTLLFKRAQENNDHFLRGKLIALGVGEIKEILSGVATLDARITKLHLKQNDLTDAHAKELGAALAKNPHLTDLSLEGNRITGEGLESLLRGIAVHNKVSILNLEKNPLTLRSVRTLKPLLHLESLNVSQTLIDDEDISILLAAERNSSLKHFNVSKTKITRVAGESILHSLYGSLLTLNASRTGAAAGVIRGLPYTTALLEVDLAHTRINDEMVTTLVRFLLSHPTVIGLNLYYNDITAKSGRVLGELLEKNQNIAFLNLGNNGLEDAGVQDLAAGLKRNTTLEVLSLSRNFIKDAGAHALHKAIASHPALRFLNLDYNAGISDGILQKLRQLQEVKTLLRISTKKMYES